MRDYHRRTYADSLPQTCGEPPLAYLARRRVEQAEVLHRDGGLSLAEIAPLVGYATAATLRRAMRRLGRKWNKKAASH